MHAPRGVNCDFLGFSCRPHTLERGLQHRDHWQWFELDLQLACRHPRHVHKVVDELGLRQCVPVDQLQCMLSCLLAELVGQQHACPSEDHVQWCAQFM